MEKREKVFKFYVYLKIIYSSFMSEVRKNIQVPWKFSKNIFRFHVIEIS